MLLRFVVLRDLNRNFRELVRVLNLVSLVAGLTAVAGNLVVASYPVSPNLLGPISSAVLVVRTSARRTC